MHEHERTKVEIERPVEILVVELWRANGGLCSRLHVDVLRHGGWWGDWVAKSHGAFSGVPQWLRGCSAPSFEGLAGGDAARKVGDVG